MEIGEKIDQLLERVQVPAVLRGIDQMEEMKYALSEEVIDDIAMDLGMDLYEIINLRSFQIVKLCAALEATLDLLENCEQELEHYTAIDFFNEPESEAKELLS